MSFSMPSTYVSKANSGYGATLSIGSPLAAIVELSSFSMPLAEVPSIPKTHLLSPNYTEEMYAGMIKPGTFELTGNFIGDPTQISILTDMQNAGSGALLNFSITCGLQEGAKTGVISGVGFFSSFEIGPFENNKNIDFKAKFQTTGSSTITVS